MEEKPRRPRFRFSLRTLFVVVMLTILLSFGNRMWILKREYQQRRNENWQQLDRFYDGTSSEYEDRLFDYHFEMAKKYDDASGRPWLPLEPDPPEPAPPD